MPKKIKYRNEVWWRTLDRHEFADRDEACRHEQPMIQPATVGLYLRRIAGVVSMASHPTNSGCLRCWRRWGAVESHRTMYSSAAGCFPLCEDCWGELSPTTRLPYYHTMYDEWTAGLTSGLPPFSDIEAAVMRGE